MVCYYKKIVNINVPLCGIEKIPLEGSANGSEKKKKVENLV